MEHGAKVERKCIDIDIYSPYTLITWLDNIDTCIYYVCVEKFVGIFYDI